jgi:hypothetical protein
MVARDVDHGYEIQVVHHYDGGPYYIHYLRDLWLEGEGATLDEAMTDLLSRAYHREPARYTGASN